MDPVASVLWYASWPVLTLAALVLWTFGMADIARHRRRGTSTSAGLLCMAGCVSFAAVVAVAGAGALFAEPWVETAATVGSIGSEAGEIQGPSRSPVFSFGMENASYAAVSPAGVDGSDAPQ